MEKVFLYTGLVGAVLFLISMFVMIVGMETGIDFDTDVDFDFDSDTSDASFRTLSFQSVVTFLTAWGLSGYLFYAEWGWNIYLSLFGSVLFGAICFCFMVVMMWSMKKLEHDFRPPLDSCVGKNGNVYISIPKDGVGQIQVPLAGVLKTLDATSDKDIPQNVQVQVVGVKDRILVVQ